jgi:hypothetical protein
MHCFSFYSTDEKSLAVRQPWFDPTELKDQANENARRAFETVLFVRQRLYTGERFRGFAANVVNFARETNRTKQLTHETVSFSKSFFHFHWIPTTKNPIVNKFLLR